MIKIKILRHVNIIKIYYSNEFSTALRTKMNKTIYSVLSKPKKLERNISKKYHIIGYIHLYEISDSYDYNSTCYCLNLFNIKQVVLFTGTKTPMISNTDKKIYFNKKENTWIIEYLIPRLYFFINKFNKKYYIL
jgi:hypothetical protein